MDKKELKGLGQLFKESSQAVRRNITLFIFLNVITILTTAWSVGLDIRDKAHGSNWSQVLSHSILGGSDYGGTSKWLSFTFFILGAVFYLLVLILTVKAANHKLVGFDSIWETFKSKWWKILIVSFLSFLLIGVGLLLFVIPGLYLLSRLALAPIIAIDQDVRVIDALNKSWRMTDGYAWVVFMTVFFGFLLGLPSLIPVFGRLIALALTIAYSVALPIRYFELKKVHGK